jgi:hypothetical protein
MALARREVNPARRARAARRRRWWSLLQRKEGDDGGSARIVSSRSTGVFALAARLRPRQAFLLEGTPRILSASSLRPLSQIPQTRKLYHLPVNQKAMAVNRKVQSSKPVCGGKYLDFELSWPSG